MFVGLNWKTLEPALVNMADAGGSVSGVPSLAVCYRYPTHEFGNITIVNRPQQKMPVIAHDAVAAKTHLHTFKARRKDAFKRLKVGSLFEYPQPAVSTVKNMINNSANTLSSGTWHKDGN